MLAAQCAIAAAVCFHQPTATAYHQPDQPPAPKGKPTVRVSGYIQAYFRFRTDANGDRMVEPSLFRNQRVRINFKGDVAKHVGYDIEVDPRAPEVAGILRDAFITLDYIPRHEIRFGQQKTQFGYENSESSSKLFTVNRTELSEGLGRGFNLRDIGIGVLGSIRIAPDWRFEDAVTLVNGSGLNVQADNTPRKNLWGRVGVRYRNKGVTVRLGLSAANGDQFEPAQPDTVPIPGYVFDFTRQGVDVQLDHPKVLFVAEYAKGDTRAPATVPDASGNSSGYYFLLVGKTKRKIGPVLKYDTLDDFKRWTIGAYFGLPADPASLLLNYESYQASDGYHDKRYYARLQVRF